MLSSTQSLKRLFIMTWKPTYWRKLNVDVSTTQTISSPSVAAHNKSAAAAAALVHSAADGINADGARLKCDHVVRIEMRS